MLLTPLDKLDIIVQASMPQFEVPDFLVDLMFETPNLTREDAFTLISRVQWGEGTATYLIAIPKLLKRGMFWPDVNMILQRQSKFEHEADEFLTPLILRYLFAGLIGERRVPGSPDIATVTMIHGRVKSVEDKRLVGDPVCGLLYHDDLLKTEAFWASVERQSIIGMFTSMAPHVQQDLNACALACARDGALLKYTPPAARNDLGTCLMAIYND